ncbi:MAG: phosphate ABC transporter permease subunit PstC [Methanosarcinales archaeon]|jgi:phosphate transport system permease protein|nr:phosphate ABC transporter permease subunit PstC [Methanosarcinales archaeon]
MSKRSIRDFKEKSMKSLFFIGGITTILVLLLIFVFLFAEALNFFKTYSLIEFFTGTQWMPGASPERFGILPLLAGSVIVTAGAIIIAVPIGILSAIYIAELAGPRTAGILKPAVELLAGIPSVVLGFFGLVILVPHIQSIFNLTTGQTALTGSIILAIMALPTIISVSEDAISSVPSALKQGSFALGSNHWQTIYKVIVPASISGISAAIILGIGRAIGETMAVMMVTGNMAIIPGSDLFLSSVRTITATIALEMGEVARGTEHYFALFAIGAVLFVMTIGVNLIAEAIKRKHRLEA